MYLQSSDHPESVVSPPPLGTKPDKTIPCPNLEIHGAKRSSPEPATVSEFEHRGVRIEWGIGPRPVKRAEDAALVQKAQNQKRTKIATRAKRVPAPLKIP